MNVVINSSPLISLGCIDKINILSDLFDEIIIPAGVYQEVVISGKDKIIGAEIKKQVKFKIKNPQNSILIEFLEDSLDKGESEVIALAKELNIQNVIIDEQKGRRIAERHGLIVIGSLGILLIAKKKGLIKSVKGYISEMEKKGIRIGEELKNKILKYAEE